ncbi:MAG: HD domain-containing protein [Candidatus Micrarchaeota archaeon]|nr:HD domain-containing protein [Candidatus Micrarchaeota archaeon]
MKFIRDPIYGFIRMEKPFIEILDTPSFQRLRGIKQLGLSHLVYPSAVHTRFEHSVGSYYLATEICKIHEISHPLEFRAAALLHDLGHAPFSHTLQLKYLTGKSHEEITVEKIKSGEISAVLESNGIDVKKVCDFILGKGLVGRLISGEVDVDRLDYLRRDAYYTGVAYGVIYSDVIIKSIEIKKNRISVDPEYVPALESILIARYMMYPTVYMHHTSRIAEAMLRKAVYSMIENQAVSPREIREMDDAGLLSLLKNSSGISRTLVEKINRRELYKMILRLGKSDIDVRVLEKPIEVESIEEELSGLCGLGPGEIIVDVPGKPEMKESRILIGGKNVLLEEFSPLVKMLCEAEWNYWYIGVYSPRRDLPVERIKKKLRSFFGA